MLKIYYGEKKIKVSKGSKYLSPTNQNLLADGRLVIETGIDEMADESIKKAYYVGALYELFKENFDVSKREIIAMIKFAYPVFMKERQFLNTLNQYEELKKKLDVFNNN